MSGLHLVLSTWGPLLALVAVLISILSIAWRGAPLDASTSVLYAYLLAIGVVALLAGLYYDYRREGGHGLRPSIRSLFSSAMATLCF